MWTNTNQQLIQGVMRHGPDILSHCVCSDDLSRYIDRLNQEHLNYPVPPSNIDITEWFIPHEYKTMDILDWLYQRDHVRLSPTQAQAKRLEECKRELGIIDWK